MWQILFWASVGFISYVYFGYPFILFVVSKLKRDLFNDRISDFNPSVCLIISAFNEEKVIRRKIENSLALDYLRERRRIIVASDSSTDRTAAIAGDYGDLGVELYSIPVRMGKSSVINEVMERVGEDIVVFTDANSLFHHDALKNMVKHFADSRIGCVVGKLSYVDRHTSCVGKGEGIYWRYESQISQLESKLGSVLVANGSIFAIRRCLFNELYPDVANDFQLPIEIGARGYGVVYEPEARAVERSTIFWREEFERKVRIVLRGVTGFMVLFNRFRGFHLWQFLSHKFARWVVGPFLLMAFVSNALLVAYNWFYGFAFIVQCAFCLAAFNGWRLRNAKKTNRLFYVPFYFTMVNLAALIAMTKFFLGERQTTWEKAGSTRFSPVHWPSDELHREPAKDSAEELSHEVKAPIKIAKN